MAEQTIDQLNIEINTQAKQSSSGMDKLIASIEKLKTVTGGGVGELTGIAASIHNLTSTLSAMKSQSGIVSSLANSINKLNEIKTNNIASSIKTLTDSLKTLGGIDPTLKTVISDLATLAKSGTGGVSGNALSLEAAAAKAQASIDKSALTSAKAQEGLNAIAEKNRQIEETARQASQQEQQLTDSINAAIQRHIQQNGSAGAFSNKAADLGAVMPDYTEETPVLTQAALTSTGSSYHIQDSVNSLKTAVGEVGGAASTAMSEVSAGSSRASGFVDKLKQSLSDAKDKLSGLGNSSNSFFSMGRFYGWYFILRQIASTFGGFITNINSYIENMNLFDVAMGKSAQSGEQLAQSLQNVLGVDSGEAMRYMGVFQELGSSFGIANKQAVTMSENMTQLGYDLASFYNISTGTAFEKLESVYTGQSRAARSLGVDISNARLQQELYNLGFKEKVNDLTQADKAELRYIAIMKQTTQAQGDMARTIQTPANALRVLQAQLSITGRAIGSIFIPALEAILPVVTAVIEIIGDLASELASLVGFKMPKIDYSSLKDVTTDADGASTAVGNIGDNAQKSKKQLDNLISGFDDVHILQTSSDDNSGTGTGSNGNILSGINLPSYDALSSAVSGNIASIKAQLEQYEPLVKEILKDALAVGAALLTWKLTTSFFNNLMDLISAWNRNLSADELKNIKGNFIEIAAGLTLVAGLFAFAYTHSENFRKGLEVLGSGIVWIGKEITDFSDSAAKSLGIKELSGELWTSTAAIIVIAIGAIAIALGAPIFGTIAVIGGAAVLAIQAIGYAASDSIEPVNLFGDEISSATEKKLKPFIQECNTLDETIKGIKWSGKIITDADVSDVKSQVKTIADTLINGLDADKNQALKNLNPLKNMLNSQTYSDILKASGQYYDKQKLTVQQGEDEINKIMQTAEEQHRSLKQSEYDEITKIEQAMETTGIKNLTESQTESNLIFQSLKDNHTALSAQEASEIVKNSAKQRDTTIDDAKKQYDGIMTEAQRMYDVGAINKDQYAQIRDAAEKSKNDTIQQAQEQHTKIVDEAKKQAGDLADQIDWTTGNIKSKWQVFWDWYSSTSRKNWNDEVDFFKIALPNFWDTTISPWFTQEKWSGLFNNVKTSAQGKWTETETWWKKSTLAVWWTSDVSPYFTKAKWDNLYIVLEQSLQGKWNETVTWWNKSAIAQWWSNDVSPWFTAKKWTDMMSGVGDAFRITFKNAVNAGIGLFDEFIDWVNSRMKLSWDAIKIAGKTLVPSGSVQLFTIPTIPKLATGDVAYKPIVAEVGEYSNASSNPEIIAPQSIIRETVEESNESVVTALAKLIELAQQIAEKDTSINIDGKPVAKVVNKINASRGYNLGPQST